jgi:cleavage stimulation factor subunit 3
MGYKDAGSLMSELIPSAEKTPKTPHQVLNQIVHHQNGGSNVPVDDIGYAKPDINHMIPFKPRRIPVPGSHPVSGGEFPMPQTAHNALKLMPPPVCFHGPFVRVDDLIDKFRSGEIPNIDEFVRNKNTKVGQKRNAQAKSQDESAVGNDVFRQRQQKRAKT